MSSWPKFMSSSQNLPWSDACCLFLSFALLHKFARPIWNIISETSYPKPFICTREQKSTFTTHHLPKLRIYICFIPIAFALAVASSSLNLALCDEVTLKESYLPFWGRYARLKWNKVRETIRETWIAVATKTKLVKQVAKRENLIRILISSHPTVLLWIAFCFVLFSLGFFSNCTTTNSFYFRSYVYTRTEFAPCALQTTGLWFRVPGQGTGALLSGDRILPRIAQRVPNPRRKQKRLVFVRWMALKWSARKIQSNLIWNVIKHATSQNPLLINLWIVITRCRMGFWNFLALWQSVIIWVRNSTPPPSCF